MRKLLLIHFLSIVCYFSSAQNNSIPYKVFTSEKFESPKGFDLLYPIGLGKNGVLQSAIRKNESIFLQQFNSELVPGKKNIVSFQNVLPERSEYIRAQRIGNTLMLFYRTVFKKEEKEGITAIRIDINSLEMIGSPVILFKSSGPVQIGGYGIFYNSGSGAYQFYTSADQKKILISYALRPKVKNDLLNREVRGVYVIDENANISFGKEITMPYPEAKCGDQDFCVSNEGEVFMTLQVYEGDRPKEGANRYKANYSYEIFAYSNNSEKEINASLNLDKRFVNSVSIFLDVNNQLALSGFYSKGLNKPTDGAFVVKLKKNNDTFEKVFAGFYEIPSDVIKSFVSEREKRKIDRKANREQVDEGSLGIYNLMMRNLYFMSDGSTRIIGEQYEVRQVSYFDNTCRCYRTYYQTYAEDVFVFNIKADGNFSWIKKLPKEQFCDCQNPPGLSINSFIENDNLHVFYMDNIRNLNLPESMPPARHVEGRGGFLTGVKIDSEGKIQKYSIGEVNELADYIHIRQFQKNENAGIIDVNRSRKKNTLISIGLK